MTKSYELQNLIEI